MKKAELQALQIGEELISEEHGTRCTIESFGYRKREHMMPFKTARKEANGIYVLVSGYDTPIFVHHSKLQWFDGEKGVINGHEGLYSS